jgi:hypothetical protein
VLGFGEVFEPMRAEVEQRRAGGKIAIGQVAGAAR